MSTREKKGRFETQKGKSHVKMKSKTGVMLPSQRSRVVRNWKRQKGPSPGAFRGGVVLLTC